MAIVKSNPPHSYIHGVKVGISSNVSIPNDESTVIEWDAEEWDSADVSESEKYHNLSEDTSHLVSPRSGKYSIHICIEFDPNNTGLRHVGYRVNSGDVVSWVYPSSDDYSKYNLSTILNLQKGDIVEVVVEQNSGDPLDIISGPSTFTTMTFLGY